MLAVEMRHRGRQIARAGDRVRPAPPARCAQARWPTGARSSAPSASLSWSRRRAPISGTMSSPRERTQAKASCAMLQPFSLAIAASVSHEREIACEILRREARHAGADFADRLRGARVIADQAARRARHRRSSPTPSSRTVGRMSLLDAAADQRILDLQRGDRMHRLGAPDRRRPTPPTGRCGARNRPSPCRRSHRPCPRSAHRGSTRAGCRDRRRSVPSRLSV